MRGCALLVSEDHLQVRIGLLQPRHVSEIVVCRGLSNIVYEPPFRLYSSLVSLLLCTLCQVHHQVCLLLLKLPEDLLRLESSLGRCHAAHYPLRILSLDVEIKLVEIVNKLWRQLSTLHVRNMLREVDHVLRDYGL